MKPTDEKSQPRLYQTVEQAIIASPELKDWQPFTLSIVKERTASDWVSIVGRATKQAGKTSSTKQTVETSSATDQHQNVIVLVALVFQQADDAYRLVEISLGDSDAEFVRWIEKYSLPAELFYDKPPADTQWGVIRTMHDATFDSPSVH